MIFVDTGYFLAVLNPRDELYGRAQVWSASIQEPLITTEYVLCEFVNSFSDPVDRPKAHAVINEIGNSLNWELLDASPQLFSAGMTLHRERSDKYWRNEPTTHGCRMSTLRRSILVREHAALPKAALTWQSTI